MTGVFAKSSVSFTLALVWRETRMDAMLSVFRPSIVYLLVVEALEVEMFSPHISSERQKISIVFSFCTTISQT